MVPATWAALLIFVLFVAPGLAFDLLSQRRVARAAESTFREISRVVLASICFSGATLAALVAVRTAVPTSAWWPPELVRLVRGDEQYITSNFASLFWTLLVSTAVSMALAFGTHCLLVGRSGGSTIEQGSAWTQAFKADCPPGKEPRIVVRLDDDSAYMGAVNEFSADVAVADRELVLRGPNLKVKRSGEQNFTEVPEHYERIVLPASKIRAITVAYWPKAV